MSQKLIAEEFAQCWPVSPKRPCPTLSVDEELERRRLANRKADEQAEKKAAQEKAEQAARRKVIERSLLKKAQEDDAEDKKHGKVVVRHEKDTATANAKLNKIGKPWNERHKSLQQLQRE